MYPRESHKTQKVNIVQIFVAVKRNVDLNSVGFFFWKFIQQQAISFPN